MFYLGKTSKRRATGVNEIIMLTIGRFLEISPIDITITWMGGKRTAKQQNAIFLNGYSQRDGYARTSYHQSGDAIDVAAYKNGKMSNEKEDALTVAYWMLKAFSELKEEGLIIDSKHLHSGVFWGDKDLDGDGFLDAQDKIGWDVRHFELRPYPQKGKYKIKLAA